MNLFKRFYCRTFQVILRIALPFLPYRNPKFLGKAEDVPDLLKEKGLCRPLLVTDQTLRELGVTRNLERVLRASGFSLAVYDGTRQNPTTQMAEDALALYHQENCDCLIAFGGGSPMDCAKAVGARVALPKTELKKMAGILKVRRRTPPMIAIPTTAGTGSETTLAAVIVDGETRHKYVINSFPLIPDYAVLDAATVHSLPYPVAASTGMDAMTHAVEAYIGRSTTKETRADAERAVKLVFANIEDAASHQNVQAEQNMLVAAHLAGRAFSRSYVGYVHAVSHSLSGQYDMPHGLTNAILLPIVLELYGPKAYKKLARLAVAAGLGEAGESEETLARRFNQAVFDLNARLGIPNHIEGILEEDVDRLASFADKEANPLYPVPVLWGREQLKTIYREAVKPHGG